MTLHDFRGLFRYSDACRGQMYETLQTVPHETVWAEFESVSRFNSIARLVAHSIAAEERWITYRIQGQALPQTYEERAAPHVDGLFADAQQIRQQTYDFLDGCQNADLARVYQIVLGGPYAPLVISLTDVLFHILNHENYHRGQIVMRLQMLGFDPPNFDYVFLRAPDTTLATGDSP